MSDRRASRYPGIRSFERDEQPLFFGRSREERALFEAVKVKPLTVLFSKSGIGKTSLLNAGLAPLLERNGFLPIFFRLQDTSISPVETVQRVLAPYLDAARLQQYGRSPHSLWEYVRACSFGKSTIDGEEQAAALTPVLVFDQFEELFSHERPARDELNSALADLLNERLPEDIRRGLRAHPREQRSPELLDWYEPLKIKVVFAIRADRLSDLDELKHQIPTVLHDRFHLKPLSRENAAEAIVKPALLPVLPGAEGAGAAAFGTTFSYAAEALSEILEVLSNEQGEIESFQLQLLCSFIESKVRHKGQVVVSLDYGGKAGIDTILNDYYEREIDKLAPDEQLAARRFIEEGLIVNGRRVGLPEGAEQSRFGIEPGLLNKLLNIRLLRTETIHLGKIYEISHDTLIEPILRSYEKRHAEEERRRAELLLAETQRKRLRARILAIAGFTLFAIALLGGIFAWRNAQKAKKAQHRTEISALAAKAWNIYRDDQTLALRIAQYAYESDTTNEEALQTILKIINEPTSAFYQTVFTRHALDVLSLAFSPDGKKIASGGLDSELYIWDHAGQIIHRFSHADLSVENNLQTGPVESAVFSLDGEKLYSADRFGGVKIWDLEGDSLLYQFQARKNINRMAVSPDERYFLTCGADSTARLWDMEGNLTRVFRGHTGPVVSISFSPDNQRIATGGGDHTARIWRIDGTLLKTIEIPSASVINDVQFSPDGRMLALACSDHTARLFTLDSQALNTLSGHTAEVSRILFSPKNNYLLTTSYDHTAKLWTLDGREILRLAGHYEKISSAAFSPDGNWVATGGYDFTTKLWNLEFNLHNRFNRHTNYVNKVAVAPNGSFIISGSADFTVKKWNFEGELLADMAGHKTSLTSVDISPDGKLIASTSNDKNIRLWTADGQLLKVFADSNADVLKAVFSNDNRYIISSNFRGEISIYEVQTGQLVRKWQTAKSLPVHWVAADASMQRIYGGGGDSLLRAWNWTGDSLWATNIGANIWAIALAPDGKSILTAGDQLPIKIWNANGQLVKDCLGHQDANYHVTWSPDGAKFASSSWDKTIKIWDKNGELIRSLPHPDGVNGAAFSSGGNTLVTACRDKIIRAWDVHSGNLLNTIGYRTKVQPFLRSPHIASLAAIPFDWERDGIAPELAEKAYSTRPDNQARLGMYYLEKGVITLGEFSRSSDYLAKAERTLTAARQMDAHALAAIDYDSLIAEVYSARCNLLLLNRQYAEAVKTARKGMRFKPLEILKLYEVTCLLLSGNFDEAVQKARIIKDEQIVQNEFYSGNTFAKAFKAELVFFRDQYGIESPDMGRFLDTLK